MERAVWPARHLKDHKPALQSEVAGLSLCRGPGNPRSIFDPRATVDDYAAAKHRYGVLVYC